MIKAEKIINRFDQYEQSNVSSPPRLSRFDNHTNLHSQPENVEDSDDEDQINEEDNHHEIINEKVSSIPLPSSVLLKLKSD
ncbi:hypothetical protein PPACK8108_LOCUS10919 [Phakopsora pachyrhizi]|uniref:Uncharacterized protein n=1 Tax=Phakopsora pachyrhizi TaxID=170000 RepID=A0AAV0B229_PHAPC|nr:hypothetical protein PPACK8108_LOCUS10919 [Phakopsora pachyrhizi]